MNSLLSPLPANTSFILQTKAYIVNLTLIEAVQNT